MRFLPFYANGTAESRETYQGYANYAKAIAEFATGILGKGGCVIETYNEVTFGSAFLNIENYYEKGKAPSNPGPDSAI